MKISHRLYFTGVPAVLGVLAVAGLGYWGQYARAVPEALLVVAAIATIGTLVLSWVNVRYIAQRVERLANVKVATPAFDDARNLDSGMALQAVPSDRDELDAIEFVVGRLSKAVSVAASDRAADERRYEERARDYAQMLARVADSATQRMDEIRLPLHILLENHFGDLNENQEEMLGAARAAAEATDADLLALREIAALDLGTRTVRRDRIFPGDMMNALLPTLQASAEKQSVVLRTEIHPLVPPIWADGAQLPDALVKLFRASIERATAGAELQLELVQDNANVLIRLQGTQSSPTSIQEALAIRILALNGAAANYSSNAFTITLSTTASTR